MYVYIRQSFLQANNFGFGGRGQACPKYPRITKLQHFGISQEGGGMKLIFLLVDKHQSFLQADTILFGGHSHGCLILVTLKVTSQERREECSWFLQADKHQTSCKSILSVYIYIYIYV